MIKKISLDADKSIGFGVLINHCNKPQQINYHSMESGEWWECAYCKQPILLVTETGWYAVGNKLKFQV